VDRLAQLQTAVVTHLATLGTALEEPMARLMSTAAEAPKAAAEVIAQLRQQMAGFSERDNQAFEERTQLVAQLDTLLQTLNQAAGDQRTAIESLVASAASVLDAAGGQFAQAVAAHTNQTAQVAAQVTGSAMELASLGEAFGHGVQLFSASNEKLADSLQRVEGAIQQSATRSDEQLAYYVAQAREVIDLSIAAQQTVVEDMRRLRSAQPALAEGVAG
jgi:exonuclease VII small subunit